MCQDIEARIRTRAYHYWLEEGQPHGLDQEHWFRALRDVRAECRTDVVISRIFFKGSKRSGADEYVEVTNKGCVVADVAGWRLSAGDKGQDFVFPASSQLEPGAVVRIYTNTVELSTGGFSFGIRRAIWNDKGDTGTLLNAQGELVSSYTYP